jgi:carbon-monoxide dehydrogenase medium subunit
MIPGGFEYHRPADIPSALSILVEHGDEARVIAGGHSLIPMMKLRMADLAHVVDLQGIATLRGIEIAGGMATIGAMVTQHELITDAGLSEGIPLIREAALQIADPQVRYVGTIGGNVANGDPGNDMPGLMQCLDAVYELEGPGGVREVAARDFYESAYFTARGDDEILTRIRIPVPAAGTGYAYEKQKRKIGDYATAAAGVLVRMEGGSCTAASIAMTNLSETPVWSEAAGAALVGTAVDADACQAAVVAALQDIDPVADNRGPVAFKKHVAGVILERAISRAVSRAA